MDSVVLCAHGDHLALAACYHVDDLGREFFRDVHCKHLDWLAFFAVNLFYDYLRLSYL